MHLCCCLLYGKHLRELYKFTWLRSVSIKKIIKVKNMCIIIITMTTLLLGTTWHGHGHHDHSFDDFFEATFLSYAHLLLFHFLKLWVCSNAISCHVCAIKTWWCDSSGHNFKNLGWRQESDEHKCWRISIKCMHMFFFFKRWPFIIYLESLTTLYY